MSLFYPAAEPPQHAAEIRPHTPGPWHVRGRPHPLFQTVTVNADVGDGRTLAEVRSSSGGMSLNEMMANARLMAAAPDLLALLTEALPHLPADLAGRAGAVIDRVAGVGIKPVEEHQQPPPTLTGSRRPGLR